MNREKIVEKIIPKLCKKEPQQVDVDKHPIQPLVKDEHGRLRFKKNDIVDHLLESNADIDLNKLTIMGFSDDDWTQFAQLIGYSFDGWGTLSYVSDDDYERAQQVNKGSEWVSVEDRLPEDKDYVLGLHDHSISGREGYIAIVKFYNSSPIKDEEFEFYEDGRTLRISHWMPLPQPPTNTEEEG